MTITARSGLLLAAATAGLALAPAPAMAQDGGVVLNILVECAKINDPSARLACFDNNIRAAGGQVRNTVPGSVRVTGGAAPVVGGGNAAGFGGNDLRGSGEVARSDARPDQRRGDGSFGNEDIRSPDRFQAPAGPESVVSSVARVQEREPGMYVMTMQDDTQWAFVETTGTSYRPPRSGSKVELIRGSLGSYLARVDEQGPVKVRRLR